MEEGGARNWRRTLDLGREELASSAEVLVLSPLTVGSGASEAQMKPGVERRAGCEMCGVYRGNGESEPLYLLNTRVTSWKPVRSLCMYRTLEIKATGSNDRK